MLHRSLRLPLLLAFALCAQAALAAFPERTITLIVPWAAGGSTDILARALAEQLARSLGQPVLVDNKAGASGNIGSNLVAKARADGYTLLIGSMSTHAMNPALMPNMPFKGVEDFTPIALMANVINTMVVHPSVPVRNVREFLAYAKAIALRTARELRARRVRFRQRPDGNAARVVRNRSLHRQLHRFSFAHSRLGRPRSRR